MSARIASLICLWLLACGAAPSAAPPATPPGAPVAPPPRSREWLTSLDLEHPLVGRVWDVQAKTFVKASLFVPRLSAAKFVLLGEKHDNPDHHRLQGKIISELVKSGRTPAVVLEMLEVQQQAAIDSYLATADATARDFGAAVAWGNTSWPPFREYQPIFEAALAAKLPLIAGNLAQADAKALVKQGLSALSVERVQELRLDQPLPESLQTPLLAELSASHCGHLPENLLEPMALAQRARDAQMAKTLAVAGAKDGAVLIAGGGHVRRDRGVPYYLAKESPNSSLVSVAFREVEATQLEPQAYVTDQGPFDYLWFTPRQNDQDPCAAFGPKQK